MKLTKLASLAMMATFALGTLSAKANIGTVTNYSKFNISITVKTNGTTKLTGHTYKYPVGTAKFDTKDLLAFIASDVWADTTFPTGAKLVVGWDAEWDGDVLVVDKTGTNVLFDASDESASVDDDAVIEVYTEYDGDSTGTYVDADPGSYSYDETYAYYFELYNGDVNTDLWSEYSTGTDKFSESWNADGDYTKWSDSQSIDLQMGGDQEVNDNDNGSMTGSIKISGDGKGYNPYFD